MHRRLYLAGLAATGGLLTSAFLQVAVAAAETSAHGADAFTIGGYTFDPFTAAGVEGWDPVAQLSTAPPLLALGGGTVAWLLPLSYPGPRGLQPDQRRRPGQHRGQRDRDRASSA